MRGQGGMFASQLALTIGVGRKFNDVDAPSEQLPELDKSRRKEVLGVSSLRAGLRFFDECMQMEVRLRLALRFGFRLPFGLNRWLRFRLWLRLGHRRQRQSATGRRASSGSAAEADVVHPQMQTVLGPTALAEVEGVDTDLGTEGLLQGVKRHRAGSKQRAIHADCHFGVPSAWCEFKCEVVRLPFLNFGLCTPRIRVVVLHEGHKPQLASALGVRGRQETDKWRVVGPEKELHEGGKLAGTLDLEREGETEGSIQALAVGLAVAELSVGKCSIRSAASALAC
mmetsp:Transcript_105529/g.303386  ORF Transcript_105529/g.303386 Transcript_105529/m.303386 type:complete len:283 (+) Transcript_105529:400-1248(+)